MRPCNIMAQFDPELVAFTLSSNRAEITNPQEEYVNRVRRVGEMSQKEALK